MKTATANAWDVHGQRSISKALEHLAACKQEMKKAGSVCQDMPALVRLDSEFESLEDAIRDFAKYQLGLDSTLFEA